MLSEGFEENITSLEKAVFILCTGFLENYEESLESYKTLLNKYVKDIIVSVAAWKETKKVKWFFDIDPIDYS